MTEDIPKLAKTVKCIAEYGYEPKKVLEEFDDIQHLDHKRQALKITTDRMEKSLAKLNQDDYSLRRAINTFRKPVSV